MDDKINFRSFNEKDYKTACDWWKWWWNGNVVGEEFLPTHGDGGYIVEKNNIPIACGFTHRSSNSKLVFLSWVVSNPHYKNKDRRSLIEFLINSIEKQCKKLGYNYLFTVCNSEHLANIHKDLNWHSTKKTSYEIFKIV